MSVTHETKVKKESLGEVCLGYLKEIDVVSSTLPFIMSVLNASYDYSEKELEKFVNNRVVERWEDGGHEKYTIKIADKAQHDKLQRKYQMFAQSSFVVPKSYLIYLISQYDAFIGNLIKCIYNKKPELLNTCEKSLTFQQLVEFKTIDAAYEYVIEKEVETVLRKSHAKQFDWMEEMYKLPLRKGLECWPVFIEATERRNLFVHNDGIVTNQYLNVCKDNGVEFDKDIAVNTKLSVGRAYFEKVHKCLFEIAVKLVHVLWRKLFKEERSLADDNLINIIYNQLLSKNYISAICLSEFATETIKNFSSDEVRRYFVINKALAYKFNGKEAVAMRIIESEDWSSCSDKFLLAVAMIKEEYKNAAKMMIKIGDNDDSINALAYVEWPLFKHFRKTEEFLSAYKAVFKEEFTLKEEFSPERSGSNKNLRNNVMPAQFKIISDTEQRSVYASKRTINVVRRLFAKTELARSAKRDARIAKAKLWRFNKTSGNIISFYGSNNLKALCIREVYNAERKAISATTAVYKERF